MKPLDPIALTRRLVDIESLTYNEGAVGEYLDNFLRERGFAVERMPVAQPTPSHYSGPRFNVYAGNGGRPDVVLSTHMDTVPPFIPSREDDLYLYGRGACDAKGIIAAQVAAAERLREAGVAVALLFVVGEERDSAGARLANLARQGQPLSHQRRAHRQPPGVGLQGDAARRNPRPRHHGSFRVPGAGR